MCPSSGGDSTEVSYGSYWKISIKQMQIPWRLTWLSDVYFSLCECEERCTWRRRGYNNGYIRICSCSLGKELGSVSSLLSTETPPAISARLELQQAPATVWKPWAFSDLGGDQKKQSCHMERGGSQRELTCHILSDLQGGRRLHSLNTTPKPPGYSSLHPGPRCFSGRVRWRHPKWKALVWINLLPGLRC